MKPFPGTQSRSGRARAHRAHQKIRERSVGLRPTAATNVALVGLRPRFALLGPRGGPKRRALARSAAGRPLEGRQSFFNGPLNSVGSERGVRSDLRSRDETSIRAYHLFQSRSEFKGPISKTSMRSRRGAVADARRLPLGTFVPAGSLLPGLRPPKAACDRCLP